MEGGRRKRKMEREEESEEEQMEKFFALIKSTKDARDRLSKEKEEEKKAKGVWKPTFEPEDFMDDEELAKINNCRDAPGSSGKHTEQDPANKESAEATTEPPQAHPQNTNNNNKPTHDLDLTLSL